MLAVIESVWNQYEQGEESRDKKARKETYAAVG
jgi:hypothetical protein